MHKSPHIAIEQLSEDWNISPLEQAVAAMPPITLEEMDAVKLLNRIDSKYVTNEATLLAVFGDALTAGYRVLETPVADNGVPIASIGEREAPRDATGAIGLDSPQTQGSNNQTSKLSPYNSVYYDTPGLQMFLDHHNKRLTRQKVRTRVYVNSGDTYLEIKRKNNHGRTKKKRTSIPADELMDFAQDAAATAYLAKHSAYTAGELSPALSTSFTRITLVNLEQTERLTIDTELRFENFRTGRRSTLKDAVIIELKQDGRAASTMKGILLDHRIKPLRVSKYCIGTTLTDSGIKSNRFKEKVRAIEKVIGQRLTTPEQRLSTTRLDENKPTQSRIINKLQTI